jgi:ADP-ribosylglycohydrolase
VMRVTWIQPEDLVRHELWQAEREGRAVSTIRRRWSAAGGVLSPPNAGTSPEVGSSDQSELARQLLDELDELPDPTADREPSDWPDILASITPGAEHPARPPAGDRAGDAVDRALGGWLGRAAGCVLGKPVEKIPRAGIEEILRSTGRWPLTRYFTAAGLDPTVARRWPWNRASRDTSLEENIDGAPEDDDLNYTLIALRTLEQHGSAFDSDDVAAGWLLDLPAGRTFTAERVAYRNLLNGLAPPQTARVGNPYREWIGAQIRTDLYGWVNPGDPVRAAEWAWRDAAVSHTRNGLYAAMFIAAMASEAVLADDVERVLDIGTSVVPDGSRLSDAIGLGRRLAVQMPEPTDAYAALEVEFAGMHWVHCLNNTALVAYALTAGHGDFQTSICLAVMGGWDTDSNGATVGGVLGALTGARNIPSRWVGPLRNRLASSIPGCDGSSFDELTARTLAIRGQVGAS